ncbi:MAG: DUF4855 domain-containing protein [Bacteroidota bacterium]|nr:DUF4855 domain-containing protein [Bacteroidota bacterium]
MKKLFIILVSIIICNISAYSKDKKNNMSISGGRNNKTLSCELKGITIEVGQAKSFTPADWQALADSKVTDFVIIPAAVENYDSTESGYKNKLAPLVIDAINQLVMRRSTAKIWIGTPGVSSRDYAIAATSTSPFFNYISYIRQQIGSTKWTNNIRGIYMNQESVYGTVDYNNIMGNPTIKLMSDLSVLVHNNLKKEFLWIPYYGYGTDPNNIIRNIGYVADQANIFDYVVIQPHYYFDGTVKTNLDGVYNSIKKQNVCYRNGKAVTVKKSKTIIGPEMELDWHIVSPNNYKDQLSRYLDYVSKYIEFKSNVPVVFYWDGNIQNALSSRINQYFE